MARAKITHRPKLAVVANPKIDFGLTPKQEKFCKIYATQEVTQTEAAIEAGYVISNAHAIASKMLNGRDFPQIRDESLANQNYASAVAAEKARGQVAGLYIDRKEILHGKIDQMDRQEVMDEIKRIQSEFPQLVNHVESKAKSK